MITKVNLFHISLHDTKGSLPVMQKNWSLIATLAASMLYLNKCFKELNIHFGHHFNGHIGIMVTVLQTVASCVCVPFGVWWFNVSQLRPFRPILIISKLWSLYDHYEHFHLNKNIRDYYFDIPNIRRRFNFHKIIIVVTLSKNFIDKILKICWIFF